MKNHKYAVCRAKFLLPLAAADRSERIQDGYILTEGELIKQVGHYTPEIGEQIRKTCGGELRVIGEGKDDIPCLESVLMPAFVKAHGHDHEQPIIGIAKDEPLTSWLDHAVNPFTNA